LWGFLYGWTSFLVIQSGTIAAVAIGFSRFLGVLEPRISPTTWIVPPIHISGHYAVSLSVQQFVGVLSIAVLTALNMRGVRLGKWIQNIFTSTKTLALLALIAIGLFWGRNPAAIEANFSDMWTSRGAHDIKPDFGFVPVLTAAAGGIGLIVALVVSQVGSLFSSDAWNNITFASEEVRNPRRNLPLALAIGVGLVTVLYMLANLAYLCTLPIEDIKNAPDDRVATAALKVVFGDKGAMMMAIAIVISTFGCNNGLILAGARVYYAMARDGLFFRATGQLNRFRVPGVALVVQGLWSSLLILPRTQIHDAATGAVTYGNLYSNLLDYVVASVLIFYILTIAGLFVLRRRRPDAERTVRAVGYPIVPALYLAAATFIVIVLALYKTKTTWPGLIIVLAGIPVYLFWRRTARPFVPQD
jgi:APA family basic amino acid/polyamine antiporter